MIPSHWNPEIEWGDGRSGVAHAGWGPAGRRVPKCNPEIEWGEGRYYLMGNCHNGPNCNFRHDDI
eukprot:9804875-Heterocapsa_arctica.AAC.1